MKKNNVILNIIILIIVTGLLLLYFEFKENISYLAIDDNETFEVKYNEEYSRGEMLELLENLAHKYNVVLGKSKVNNKNTSIYLSINNNEITDYLGNYFDIKEIGKSDRCYVSTYVNDKNQCGLIKDLFNNTKYDYYSFNDLKQNNDSIYGSYFLFYKDYNNFQNFQSELNNLLGYNSYSNSYVGNTSSYVLAIIFLVVVILSIFNFVFQLYYSYKNLYKIGCLKLLGFNINKTIKNIYKNNSLIIIIVSIVLLLLLQFVKNITYSQIILIGLSYLVVFFVNIIIEYLSCYIIYKDNKLNEILKKRLTFSSLQKVTEMVKILLSIILIITLSYSYNVISNLSNSLKDYKSSKNLLEYGVFDELLGEPVDHMKYMEQYNFFNSLKNSNEYFYSQFYDVSLFSNNQNKQIEKLGKIDNKYYFGTVDLNYLIKENIDVYDLNNNVINKNTIKDVYFIFPKSKKNIIKDFEKYYKSISTFYFSNIKRDYYFKAYLYDNTRIDTYRIESNAKYLNSPIIRVIDNSYNIPSFINELGYSMCGKGLNTGLKIKVLDQDKLLKQIDEYSSLYGLTNMISSKTFTTYNDYFSDEILKENIMLLIITITILFSLISYIIMQKEYSLIYFNNNKKKIFVKKLMGFDNDKIYEKIYTINFKNAILSIIISIIILLIINKFNLIILIISVILYLLIDYFIINRLVNNFDNKEIYLEIKGGNYD